jgi:hypothetical protein
MMTLEIAALFGADRMTDSAVSPLADNVVMLGYRRDRDVTSRPWPSSRPAPVVTTAPSAYL